MIEWLVAKCGIVCDILIGKYPTTFSIIGLCIVVLIFLRLRRIDKYIVKMNQEAAELKMMARFPYCEECGYKDTCNRRIAEMDECTYEYRKSLVAR